MNAAYTISIRRSPFIKAAMVLALCIEGTSIRLVADEPKSSVGTKAHDSNSDTDAKAEAVKQLEEIGWAMRSYYRSFNRYPDPAILDNNTNPLLSWRVALLPFLDDPKARELYEKFHLDEPWDSEHNKALITEMPDVFKCPTAKHSDKGMTVYQLPRGDSTMFPNSHSLTYLDIPDGTSKTISLVEVDDQHAVPWTKPDDWKFNPLTPSFGLGGHFQPEGKGFFAVIADRSVKFLSKEVPRDDLVALFTRGGGELATFVEP